MVFFSCGSCGEQVKKPKVEKHLGRCRTTELACIDCNVTFNRTSYDSHKTCVTENERYGGKDYVEKGNKGDEKQRLWLEKITKAMKKAKLSHKGMQVWKMLENGGFENIPRKEKKFVNFVKNSLGVRDTYGADEVWKIFDAAFEKTAVTPTKKVKSKAVEVKSTEGKPWWEQFTPSKKKKAKSSSESEEEAPKEKVCKKAKLTKRKKESSSLGASDSDEAPPAKKQTEKNIVAKKAKCSSSSSDSSDEEEKPVVKKVKKLKKKASKKTKSSGNSSSDEEKAPRKTSSPTKKAAPGKKEKLEEENPHPKKTASPKKSVVAEKPAVVKKVPKKAESSPDTSSSEEDAPIKKKNSVPAAVPKPKVEQKKVDSSSDSSSSEEEAKVTKKKAEKKVLAKKKVPAKKEESSSGSSSSEEEPPKKKAAAIKKAPVKKIEPKKSSSSSSSSSSEDEAPKKKLASPRKKTALKKKVETLKVQQESSSSSEEEKAPVKKVTSVKKTASKKRKPESSSSSSSSSSASEEEAPKKKVSPKKKTLDKNHTSDSESDSASSGIGSDVDKAVKVPLMKVLANKVAETLPVPIAKQAPMTPSKPAGKDDFNKERDSRTMFVKNLPFDTTIDDLWNVFGKDEEMTIDCRFIMNRETQTHKGLAFIEYATREKCVDSMERHWKVHGRPAVCMQAGTKNPANAGGKSNLSQDEKDKRTIFVKGLPFSSTPDELIELFGCSDARLLKDHATGKSKGMAFCQFLSEKDADEVYNFEDGFELGGRWLQLDKLRPKSELSGGDGGRKSFGSGQKRNMGAAGNYGGKKIKFDN